MSNIDLDVKLAVIALRSPTADEVASYLNLGKTTVQGALNRLVGYQILGRSGGIFRNSEDRYQLQLKIDENDSDLKKWLGDAELSDFERRLIHILERGPKYPSEIAGDTGWDVDKIRRQMLGLASHGIICLTEERRYRLAWKEPMRREEKTIDEFSTEVLRAELERRDASERFLRAWASGKDSRAGALAVMRQCCTPGTLSAFQLSGDNTKSSAEGILKGSGMTLRLEFDHGQLVKAELK